MTMVSAAELARALNVSRTRVGQYVQEGKLDGCFTGQGHARRFDLERATAALRRGLHPGQMMGNGAETKKALQGLQQLSPAPAEAASPNRIELPRLEGQEPASTDGGNADRYDLARTLKAEEEARKLRRMNQEAEGKYVLASEVERQTRRLMAQEIAEVEAMLRDGARQVADRLGLDFKAVRKILMEVWRAKRGARAHELEALADAAQMTPKEREEDI